MQKSLIYKVGAIMLIVIILMIALSMIRGVIQERQMWREAAYDDIARSLAGNQKMVGPVLVVPYNRHFKITTKDPVTEKLQEETGTERDFYYILPETLNVEGLVSTEERHRGIYNVPIYSADMKFKGNFNVPPKLPVEAANIEVQWKDAFVWVSVSDNRGITSRPVMNWQGERLDFIPGSDESFKLKSVSSGGISAKTPIIAATEGSYNFSFDMTVAGTKRLNWVPSAKDMTVRLTANWPHPSFVGNFLPAERKISAKGFTANWQVSHFASSAVDIIQSCAMGTCDNVMTSNFGVEFITPVDAYMQTERAAKYGLLFIGLTFISFFLFEVMKRLPVHPVQYGLVGVSLAVFFQLLVSLSEHITFIAAYGISASACVVLLGVYISAVLKSVKRGAGFAAGLAALYAVLYGLLQSEDNALLMGSLLIFSVLAAIMLLTRKVDWYKIGLQAPASN